MNTDDFEKCLVRQPVRQIPADWKNEILQAAQAAVPTRVSRLATLRSQLFAVLWPHPKAWAGLASVWLLIVASHFYNSDRGATVTKNSPPPSPELLLALKQQRHELAKLIEPAATLDADRRKTFSPGPRSEARFQRLNV